MGIFFRDIILFNNLHNYYIYYHVNITISLKKLKKKKKQLIRASGIIMCSVSRNFRNKKLYSTYKRPRNKRHIYEICVWFFLIMRMGQMKTFFDTLFIANTGHKSASLFYMISISFNESVRALSEYPGSSRIKSSLILMYIT